MPLTIADAKPAWRRHLTPHVVAGEAVYLVSEQGVSVVKGALAAELANLLDGSRTVAEISAAMAPTAPARVIYALDGLVQRGFVSMTAVDPAARRSAAFWEIGGTDAALARERLASKAVSLVCLGDAEAQAVAAGLAAAGVTVNVVPDPTAALQSGDLVLAVVDDYLHPGLRALNEAALTAKQPWLLAKPIGSVVWFGPFFRPGDTGCWACLANRLEANRQASRYLEHKLGGEPLIPCRADLPATVQLSAAVVGLHMAQLLVNDEPVPPVVTTIDVATLTVERHILTRRPQCPACGDPGLMGSRAYEPVVFQVRAKAVTVDGGHRSSTPEEMLARYMSQVSSVTGVVTMLHHVEAGPTGLHLYTAGQNLARQVADLANLRKGMRSLSCGKGMTDVQARASALGEAIERYSGVFQGDEALRKATFEELGDDAVHPRSMHLFSESQYANRVEANAAGSNFNKVFDPLPDDHPVQWAPAWSLTHERQRFVAAGTLYYGYPHAAENWRTCADSNGTAAGTSLEDATLQGYFELVERDSVALWWYNRLCRPAIDLASFANAYVDDMVAGYAAHGRELWALDLTSDLGVPAIGAISRRVDNPTEDILIAFGSHFDPEIALLRAITEMNQFLPSVLPAGSRGAGVYSHDDPELLAWWATATVENQPYLLADTTVPGRTRSHWPEVRNDDLCADIDHARQLVEAQGLEMLVVNQTRPDIGLPVVKVIVPGLRHFWARFAPGRLYEVPVSQGWIPTQLTESQLNPVPVFI